MHSREFLSKEKQIGPFLHLKLYIYETMAGKEVVSPSAPPKLLDFSGVCRNTYSIVKIRPIKCRHDISLKGNDKHIVSFNKVV